MAFGIVTQAKDLGPARRGERAQLLGGEVRVHTETGKGFTLEVGVAR